MRKFMLFAGVVLLGFGGQVVGQQDSPVWYRKTVAMIPMRDGVKLFTVILSPMWAAGAAGPPGPSPILIVRTPYGADWPVPDDSVFAMSTASQYYLMAQEGYIFARQDVRGKYKSEGTMQIHQPLIHLTHPGAVDESTDTWDAVDWLIKNVPGNNGKAGIFGISYPGWLALVGSVDPHPALKAASEQACMGDLFLGDDFHHNGAFRLSYGMEYSYEIEHDKTTDSDFPFPQFDLYDWYLQLGSLKHVNERYFHGTIPTWNNFVAHPSYDSFWQTNSTLSYVRYPAIPQLHVGGYFDQEDLNGPQLMYGAMEKKDTFNRNYIVLGPWYHGEWASRKGDSLGQIAWGSNTAQWSKVLQKKWFDYWLRGIGDGYFDEANCFQTGSNVWKTYSSWPPKEAVVQNLYAAAGGKASFAAPTGASSGSVSYVSDPAKPVPYRPQPIEMTYGKGSRWQSWHVDDQRFAYSRPDVVSFVLDSLTADLTVTGSIIAHLWASTTGTDADWVVKLIDVYPNWDSANWAMSGYMLPVAMEVFRGRFRAGFDRPAPLVPGRPEEFVINLHQINHVFKKGHRMMIQVQSSWFPVIDRNPQKYVANIFEAGDGDFIKAEETVYYDVRHPTHLELPVMR
ncbi:MAG TPA: CocE/NonD family hydrolase [Puia sp.]|jgi:putative CocE/NonD family hydrolase|nr:CocE/NonD family hydrolase [Puia sp.]